MDFSELERVKKYRIEENLFVCDIENSNSDFLWGFELATVGFASSKDYHYATDVIRNSFLFQVITISL